MSSGNSRSCVLIGSISLILLISIFLCGCTSTSLTLNGKEQNETPAVTVATLPAPLTTPVTTPVQVYGVESAQAQKARAQLDNAWRTLRVINTDVTEDYLELDLTKSDDINYLRYQMVPETIARIQIVSSDLENVTPATLDQYNETRTLIDISNYTILKYEGLSTMLHATQYATIRDPVSLKAELRKAKFTIMDALDIVNSRDNSAYPSRYRDQMAADKRELDDMASQIDSYTRTVYMAGTG